MQFTGDPLTTSTSYPKLTGPRSKRMEHAVLSPESSLLITLSSIFQSLEASATNLLVTWESFPESMCIVPPYTSGRLQVCLPRYNLSFFVGAHGDLECKELPGMFVSCTQSIDTLFGLKNKLVLDPKDSNTTRKIILPALEEELDVSLGTHYHKHPVVTIRPSDDADLQIRTFIYDVDSLIGRLIGDGTVTSWYLLVYLHILTSSHLPDPLTHRTGVQQALAMLKSANSFAFIHLTAKDLRLLESIHKLTPVRRSYPPHLPSMEQVDWHHVLSPLSQSELFAPLIENILDYWKNQRIFNLKPSGISVGYEGSPALRARAEFRNARLVSNELSKADGK